MVFRRFSRLALFAFAACVLEACVGTTGDDAVVFQAAASGPEGIIAGQPLLFPGSRGWQISLETARLHIGALYLSDSVPVSGAQATTCTLPGNYVAQVTQGRDIDLLSSQPQLFPVLGAGVTLEALAGQVWLTGGDVNDPRDPPQPTIILQLAGRATLAGAVRPFQAQLTIASNRISSDAGPAGAATICKERIVSPIPASLRVQTQGALWLRVDPRYLFTNVDFGALSPDAAGDGFSFKDDSSDQPSANLYNNLKQGGGGGGGGGGSLYSFSWVQSLP